MTLAVVPTGPADLRDQRWLDERIAAINDGIDAVLDIAANWTAGRDLSRLHPGTAAQDYILARVPSPLGPGVIKPLLVESNWSNRQIAAVAGVSRNTVNELAQTVPVEDRPAKTLGADGKERPAFRPRLDPTPYEYGAAPIQPTPTEDPPIASEPDPEWLALSDLMDRIESLSKSDAAYIAAVVPERRRAATAKRLRKLGTYLGRIAWTLEGNEGTE